MGKYGKKNKLKIDPLAYNLGLIGESGIGKTTLVKEVCEQLVGEDGYMIFNIGKEDGIDAIANASYEDIPDWETFDAVTSDIIENKTTDYKDLKIIAYDTFDELIDITEPEVIRLHNKEYPDKRTKSIKAAFGGYMKGEDKAIELVLDRIWELKQVGVSMFIIGHTKRKSLTDIVTGMEYEMLTTNMSTRYFNAIKTKLHVLGVASINRDIEKTRQKDKMVGNVVSESRIITFRDDNFNIDSKSRFADIIPQIPLDKDAFISAVEDAIKKEFEKDKNKNRNIEEVKKEQKIEKEKTVEKAVKENKKKIDADKNEKYIELIKDKFSSASDELKEQVKELMTHYKIPSFKDPDTLSTEGLGKIAELLA